MNNDDFTVLLSGSGRCCWVNICTVWPLHSKWASRAVNLWQILHYAWIFLCRNYLGDSEGYNYGQLVIGSFITIMHPFMPSHLMQIFLAKQQITQETQPSTSQIWHPATSGFSQNWNHLWKGRDFRPLMRFRKEQGSRWQLGELCEVARYLLWRRPRCHCPMYNVSGFLYLLQ